MNNKKVFKEMSLEEVLAYCLDLIGQGELNTQDCLERFPLHQNELEPLLKKYVFMHSKPTVSPRPELMKRGYKQLLDQLVTRQSVTF